MEVKATSPHTNPAMIRSTTISVSPIPKSSNIGLSPAVRGHRACWQRSSADQTRNSLGAAAHSRLAAGVAMKSFDEQLLLATKVFQNLVDRLSQLIAGRVELRQIRRRR